MEQAMSDQERLSAMTPERMDFARKVLYAAMMVGKYILLSGGEVNRVEDSIQRIIRAYQIGEPDVFTITSTIIATLYLPDRSSLTQSVRISQISNDFLRLDRLNQLSRDICQSCPDPDTIPKQVEEILQDESYGFSQQVLIYALISLSFTLFFGGNTKDMLCSAVIGVLLRFLTREIVRRGQSSPLLHTLILSILGGIAANLLVYFHLGDHRSLISIGNIMILIPGLSFTNSIRDLFVGDTIAGGVKLLESTLLAVTIALGFTVSNLVFG